MKREFQLTKDGVDNLQAELEELTGRRRGIAQKIKTAREFGDLSENAEYQAAMDEHQKTEARIAEIEHILKNVELITKPKNVTEVELGNQVTIKGNNGTQTFSLVGSVEANPSENTKFSIESPIGKALLGKGVGDTVQVGTGSFKIQKIE